MSHVLSDLKNTRPDSVQQLRKRAWLRFGSDHPDHDLLDPFPVPLTIIGSKYDLFQDMEPEKKKMVSRTLRFIAHTNGASLYVSCLLSLQSTPFLLPTFPPPSSLPLSHLLTQFISMKSDVLVNRARQLLSNLAFGSGLR